MAKAVSQFRLPRIISTELHKLRHSSVCKLKKHGALITV